MTKSNIIEFPQYTTLIVPGYRGSGPEHWQTWLEHTLPDARQVSGIDWDTPNLERWADSLRIAIRYAAKPVWLIAHSFGCLAAVAAAHDMAAQVAGALLVAPCDPNRFSRQGLCATHERNNEASIASDLPQDLLGFPTLILTSSNDPWMKPSKATYWADRWGSVVLNLGKAGHVNEDSGFTAWPEGLALFRAFQKTRANGLATLNQVTTEQCDLPICEQYSSLMRSGETRGGMHYH